MKTRYVTPYTGQVVIGVDTKLMIGFAASGPNEQFMTPERFKY